MKKEDIEKAAVNYDSRAVVFRAFKEGVEWFRRSLFHKTKDEVPQPIGDYANEIYP